MGSSKKNVIALCYCNINGSIIKYGSNGVYYEGSTTKKFRITQKTKLRRLFDELYSIFGLDKETSKFEIFGKYPVVVVSSNRVTYAHLPVVDDGSLETMLEVPSNHPSIKNVELYLEVKSNFDDADTSSKRQKMMSEVICSSVLKPCLLQSSLWIDDADRELRVGLCFKDRDEMKKAVGWWSIKGKRKFVVREIEKDMWMFECVRWKCKWLLRAARVEEHGLVEIIKYTGPHTCDPDEDFDSAFEADEIEHVVKVHPTLSITQLKKWWKEKFGYELETSKMRDAKYKAITRLFGDEDKSFRVLPKLMSAFHSSNGLLVDWQYDVFPNPEFASFRSVFWAFPQSIDGFQLCRPLIVVDTRDLLGKYRMKLMIASGVDAAYNYFPLAFAVTKEVSVDSWRWFLTRIREKVTQRQGLCLISSYNQDILDVINEPESQWKEPWAYHRFCLNRLCSLLFKSFQYDHGLNRLMKKAGSTIEKKKFDYYMKEIEKKNPEARSWLDQIPQSQWALAHDNGLRYGIMKIDREALFAVCQSFSYDNLTMLGSVVLLFDELRDAFDESLSSSRDSLNRGDMYTKPVMDKLEKFMTCSATYIITPLKRDVFQAEDISKDKKWIVRLNDSSTCTCGNFQVLKFPCLHALAVCDKFKINPLRYVDDCYSVERHYKTYATSFSPVPELIAWPEGSGVPTLLPPLLTNASVPSKPETRWIFFGNRVDSDTWDN